MIRSIFQSYRLQLTYEINIILVFLKFNHEKHPINLLYKLYAELKKEKSIRLAMFETKSTDALSLYVSIIDLHRTIKDWFEDREIYHFLGFLFDFGGKCEF